MIDIANVKYDLYAIRSTGEYIHLTPVASEISWEEQPNELAVRLQFSVRNQLLNGAWLHEQLQLGGRTILKADWGNGWKDIHHGTIFDWHYTQDGNGMLRVKSYDMLIYLLRSKDDRWYKNGTQASAIIRDIAKSWNIPLGQMDLPSVALAAQPFRSQTLAAMMASVMDQVHKRGKGRYVIRASNGQMHVVKTGQNKPVYRFDANVVSLSSDQQDIEDLVTRIKIVGKKAGEVEKKTTSKRKTKKKAKTRLRISDTLDGQTKFGILQEIIYSQQYDTASAVREAALEVLKERGQPRRRRSVTVPDLPFIRRGDKVYIAAGTLLGDFIVDGVRHDADNRIMTLEVTAADA